MSLPSSNESIAARDVAVLWHPCTQMKDHETLPPVPIKNGQGIWLYDYSGNRYIDAVSSWWVNLFGHANPRINAAISDQLNKLEHVILAGFSHEPAIELAEKLVDLAQPLSRCFYVDNGSCAIEAALKMSFHYWLNSGRTEKKKFVHLTNSYHGETIGAMSVSDVSLYKSTYKPLMHDFIAVDSPDCFLREEGVSWQQHTQQCFSKMERLLAQQQQEIAAVIIEPLVQCAGSMRMYHPDYLRLLREACDRYEIHLIADEIAVGFGRTGTFFACEQANISPDFMCLSKGITAGYLPLAAVLTSEAIYQAFYDDYQTLKGFLHSHSYTGNALACRAALETLAIFSDDHILEKNQTLIARLALCAKKFNDHPYVAEVRQQGMILAVELGEHTPIRKPYPWQARLGMKVFQYGLKHEVLLRPLGNVVYFIPPYVITAEQIDYMTDVALKGIEMAVSTAGL